MELSNWKSNDWHPLWLNWNSISYRIFVLLPLIVTTFLLTLCFKVYFPFLNSQKKKLVFLIYPKNSFFKVRRKVCQNSPNFDLKTFRWTNRPCTYCELEWHFMYFYLMLHLHFKPRSFKFLPAFWRTVLRQCNGNFNF